MIDSILRPRTLSAHGLLAVLVVCLSTFLPSALAIEPQIVKTEVATYKIWQFDRPGQDFEVTADGRFVVGLQRAPDGYSFYASKLDDMSLVGKTSVSLRERADWRIVGSELYIAHSNGWRVHRVPDLAHLRDIERMPKIPLSMSVSLAHENLPPIALPVGWLDHGLVLDDTASKVIATLRGCGVDGWTDRSGELPQMSVRMNTDLLMRQLPYEVSVAKDFLTLHGFDSIPIKGIGGSDWKVVRAGDDWMAVATSSGRGIFVRVEKFSPARDGPPSQFSITQPSLTLDSTTDWKYSFLGVPKPVACAVSTYPAIDADGKLDLTDGKNYPLLKLGSFHSFQQCDEFLNETYLLQAGPEYERVVGKPAEQIPVCFEVTAKRGEAVFTHYAWSEMSREELLHTFAPTAIERDPIDREKELAEIQAKELASRQAQLRAVEENHERIVREDQEAKSLQLNRQIEICGGVVLLTMGVAALGFIIFFAQREQ